MQVDRHNGAVLSTERTARREDGGKIGSKELQMRRSDSFMTPIPDGDVRAVAKDQAIKGSPDGEEIPKCKLAFEEEQQREEPKSPERQEAPAPKPRTSRTTATKVSASLISKIENNESGNDLKITSLVPFDHLSQLCRALLKNTSTERLDLEGCGVGDKGCALIRDLLMGNRVIKHVDLQMNQVTDVGCRSLAEILPRNTTLHKLYLGYNDIRDDGVYALIGAMRPRGQLEVFVNGNTHVSDQALSRLDRALDQQWRSAPKPKKESAPYADSPRTMTRSRVEERSEETEGREAKRARAESAARKVPKANVSLMLQDDVLLGEPFEFKFVSSERHSTDLSPETSEHSRIHLRQKFLTQWRRLQNAISELLAQEARDLTLPMAGKSLCQTACQFLSMQKSTKSSMLAQHRLQMQERMRWEACATGGQLTEEARRKKVESRVHALLVKLRHMEEDMVRQQRAEAVSQAQALPHSFGEEQGAGCLLLVPCPFRVQICLKHLSGCLST